MSLSQLLLTKQRTKFTLFDFVLPETLEMTWKALKTFRNNNWEKQSKKSETLSFVKNTGNDL